MSAFIEASRKAYDNGRLLLAIIEAKNAVRIDPLSGVARAQLGLCLNQAGDVLNAEDQLRRARFLGAPDSLVLPQLFQAMLARSEFEQLLDEFPDPGVPPSGPNAAIVLRARALAFQAMNKTADANASIDRSLALLRDTKGLVARGEIALQQGNFENARSFVEEALKTDPKDAESLDLKVRVALAMHDDQAALTTANLLVSLYPQSLNSRFARINVYFAMGLDDRARPDVELAEKEFPKVAVVEYYRAVLLARSNHAREAWQIGLTLPREFIESDPSVAKNVAQMAIESGNLDPAGVILKLAILNWPGDVDDRITLAAIRLQQNTASEALSVLLPLENSKDPRVAMLFVKTYTALHRAKDAQKYAQILKATGGTKMTMTVSLPRASAYLADWLKSHPRDVNARRQYAQSLFKLGDQKGAQAQYEIALHQSPDDVVLLNNLAWLIQRSDPRRALSLIERAAKLAPGSASVLDTEGWIAFGQNDKNTALDALNRAHALNPNSPTICYHLAKVLDALGRLREANVLLGAALANSTVNFDGRDDAVRLRATLH